MSPGHLESECVRQAVDLAREHATSWAEYVDLLDTNLAALLESAS